MIVHIPSPLLGYTNMQKKVSVNGETINLVLKDLNNQFSGITFRIIDEQGKIRPHIKIFINTEQIYSINNVVYTDDEIHIITALSGG